MASRAFDVPPPILTLWSTLPVSDASSIPLRQRAAGDEGHGWKARMEERKEVKERCVDTDAIGWVDGWMARERRSDI